MRLHSAISRTAIAVGKISRQRPHRDRRAVERFRPSGAGQNEEIKQFCEKNYRVDFPLAAKEKVSGGDAHPFYQWAANEVGEGAAPSWNFHKYLIGPYGELAGAYPSQVKPLDQAITDDIERLLATSKP